MTFEEAVSLVDRIKDQVVGAPVKGRLIESLFIGPTNWEEMHVFMNICLQKGEDEAIDEFIGKRDVYKRQHSRSQLIFNDEGHTTRQGKASARLIVAILCNVSVSYTHLVTDLPYTEKLFPINSSIASSSPF